MRYFSTTIRGISWIGSLRAATRLITFLKLAVLARLLTPFDFGLFGIAALVLAFLEIITETGINVLLIQGERSLDEHINTSWVISIIRGILISLIILTYAPFISEFFNSPESLKLLYLASVIPLLKGFINPAIVKFQKDLQFNKEFFLRFTIFSIDTLVVLILAFLTKSATSLVWGMISGAIFEVFFSLFFIKPAPSFKIEAGKIKAIVSRGKWVTLYGLFNYLFEHGDDIAVGRVLNTALLGTYQVAYRITSLPLTEVGVIFNQVTFPVFTKISEDKERLKMALIKTTLVVSLIVLPFGLILYFYPKEVVSFILGDSWLEAVPVIKILAFFGVYRTITTVPHNVFLALKKQEYVTYSHFSGIIGLIILLIPLINKYGIVGAGFSAMIGAFTASLITGYYTLKIFKTSAKTL